MSFFEDPTVTDLLQRNIERVDKMEEAQQRKLIKAFRIVRNKLNDRLLVVPEGTFTEQQLNVTLIQVTAAIEAIKRDLKGELNDASEILGIQGIKDLAREITKFEQKFTGSVQPLNLDAILLASEANNFLINKYDASIDAYGADLRSQISTQLFQALISRDTNQRTVSEMKTGIGKFFLGEEWKLNRIVRTEMHNIYNYTKMKGLGQVQETLIPDMKKSLMHPMDSRTGDDSKLLSARNPVVDINEPFVFKFKGKERVFQFPPDRPNDRAILIPFREVWDKGPAGFKTV